MISFFFSIQGVSIENVVNSGPGLVFITYPEVVLKLPGGPIWAVTFFVMLVVKYLDLFENLLLI
jgi:SNF family Na+-dependent transporter